MKPVLYPGWLLQQHQTSSFKEGEVCNERGEGMGVEFLLVLFLSSTGTADVTNMSIS